MAKKAFHPPGRERQMPVEGTKPYAIKNVRAAGGRPIFVSADWRKHLHFRLRSPPCAHLRCAHTRRRDEPCSARFKNEARLRFSRGVRRAVPPPVAHGICRAQKRAEKKKQGGRRPPLRLLTIKCFQLRLPCPFFQRTHRHCFLMHHSYFSIDHISVSHATSVLVARFSAPYSTSSSVTPSAASCSRTGRRQ